MRFYLEFSLFSTAWVSFLKQSSESPTFNQMSEMLGVFGFRLLGFTQLCTSTLELWVRKTQITEKGCKKYMEDLLIFIG